MERANALALVVALLVGVAGGGVAAAVVLDAPGAPAGQPTQSATAPQNGSAQSSLPEPDARIRPTDSSSVYTVLYNRTIDSVVTIRVRTARGTSQGSGFVYDAAGHVVTNQHVVGSAEQVMVRFSDGTWRTAQVLGTDVYTDLAVLDVRNVPAYVDALPVSATNPEVGQRVAALGSPFGLEGSITSGIVSGVNRSMRTGNGFAIPATVQTDAPINPGNSGGPLVSLNGTVVGVNRAKSGDNIGFAISPQLVTRVVPELIADGDYDHPYMGIRTVPVTPAVAEASALERTRGVLVVGVLEGGPSAGVLEPATERTRVDGQIVRTGGDIILSIDGIPITSQQQLARILMLHTRPDETVSVTVLRDGDRRTVEVTLGERPEP
ncbi:MAG: S1C family serine protease [Halorientalis sp.]